MPTVYVQRKVQFNAAHRMHNPTKSDAWNQETYDKCNSPNWHGHNYTLEVVVAGEPHPETGYVIDLGQLKQIINDRIVSRVDHKNLNLDVDFLRGVNPSAENLAVAFWGQLEAAIPVGRLHAVRLHETDNNLVEYRGD
jgi:6-pyruvoyltetrahydropterin/6-carboxytetrahydropterin synthase